MSKALPMNLEFLGQDSHYPLWLRVGILIDGLSPKPMYDANLVFDHHHILFTGLPESLPPKETLKSGQDSPDFDLTGYTVMPGLIDAHAHIFLQGGELDFEKRKAHLAKSSGELLRLARGRFGKLIHTGVMAVRDAGDKDGVGLALSAARKASKNNSTPYIDSPGSAVHREGRYGSFMGTPLENFDTPMECVENRIKLGADRIKLISTGIINLKKGKVTAPPQMTSEEVTELVQAARSHKKQTFAHASGAEGIENAIQGGVDSVEHGFLITHSQLSKLRDHNVAWVPTFAPVQMQVDLADQIGWDNVVISNLNRVLENHAASLQKAVQLDVQVIAGSDAGSFGVRHGLGLLYELEIMERAGMRSLAAINAATGVSSSRLGYSEKIGCLRPGFKSRMIFSKHDILKTVKHLQLDKTCFFDGKLFHDDGAGNYEGL